MDGIGRGLIATKVAVGVACSYEVAAITSKKVPTISQMCKKHRWLEVVIVGLLVIHLHRKEAVCQN